jgi:hypothetical protein
MTCECEFGRPCSKVTNCYMDQEIADKLEDIAELVVERDALAAQLAAAERERDAWRREDAWRIQAQKNAAEVAAQLADAQKHLDFHRERTAEAVAENVDAKAQLAALRAALDGVEPFVAALRAERDALLRMLAEWCVAVDNDSSWDGWDHHYKDARYRPGPMREALDSAIKEVQDEQARYDAALERT